jgi:hypothetical protein
MSKKRADISKPTTKKAQLATVLQQIDDYNDDDEDLNSATVGRMNFEINKIETNSNKLNTIMQPKSKQTKGL